MCGIFGWIAGKNARISNDTFIKGIRELLLLSEMRGKEASGICCVDRNHIQVYKRCIRAKKLMNTQEYAEILQQTAAKEGHMVMGHARMVTNGSRDSEKNNQPVLRNDLICIHNGIIVNDTEIWNKNPDMDRGAEVDTEVFLALLEKYHYQDDLLKAFHNSLMEMEGSLSIALIDRTSTYLLLYTNVGSLYVVPSKDRKMLLFASEKYILEQTIKKERLTAYFRLDAIRQIEPRRGMIVNIETCRWRMLDFNGDNQKIRKGRKQRDLINKSAASDMSTAISNAKMLHPGRMVRAEELMRVDLSKIHALRRCTQCLLPETFPGISFDELGVCSICHAYKRKLPKGEDALRQVLKNRIASKSRYDCIVPLSGGRDSCYMLHYIVKELGLKPVAYTYDWGMVTDLARRNIQRMCSALGVEHILISADITRKRKNIQLNVNAWLRHPELATVPLFMAGDKQFFYYAQMLKRQMRVGTIVFGMNSLEETQFKVRFSNIKETGKGGIHYNLSVHNKYNLLMSYAKEFVKNPAYLNKSLIDSLSGFCSYYFLPKDYIQFFDYIRWDQKEVESVILEQYGWERAKGTNETWRIGDGTAPFYNYIYYRMAGFTEFDTFKSNQIREGIIDRETALASLDESNRVSVEDFVWYCDTIGVDPIRALKIINSQRTLYDR